MHMFADNPITSKDKDAFGFATYVEVLEEVILQTTPRPFCIGVFGPWGSGKSSFMQMLRSSLKERKIPTIWFNPWKYDQKEDLWNALIQTVLSAISEHIVDEAVKDKIKDLAQSASWLALKKAITALTVGVISEANLDAISEAFNKTDEKYYRHINHFEEDFAFVAKHYSNDDKLVIFIDDLDRCLPENAITVLESLKLFFDNEYCIFVVGIDHDVVEEGINHRYAGKVPLSGRDYLDKIIQIPFFLPHVSHEKLQASLPTDQIFSEEIWDIIQLAMEGNPRKTRRFINSFSLAHRFLNSPDQSLQRRIQEGSLMPLSQEAQNIYLAKILVFEMNFPDFYRHLQHNPGDWEYLVEKVIQGDTGKIREDALEKNKKLNFFWNDSSAFKDFMSKTSGRSYGKYPPAPGEEIVALLLRATNLVTEISNP